MRGVVGAVIGDVIGSYYENTARSTKDYNIELYNHGMRLTDDTIHTCAICDWLLNTGQSVASCRDKILEWSKAYIGAGYGPMFKKWILGFNNYQPYNSFGNGSAMRVSPVGWAADSLEEALELAKASALCTHNHPEGIKGAQVVAGIIYCYRTGMSKEEILEMPFVKESGYDLSRSYQEVHDSHAFDCTCQGSVPESIICWLNSNSYEDCIRKAIACGGDSDTMAAIAGSIVAAKEDVPDEMITKVFEYGCCFDNKIVDILNNFTDKYVIPKTTAAKQTQMPKEESEQPFMMVDHSPETFFEKLKEFGIPSTYDSKH